jgi:putative peptide zinc metalloprotease protein
VFTRQTLRGAGRYVVHDPVTFQNHVFDLTEYRILTSIVPGKTLAEVFARLVEKAVLTEAERQDFHDFVITLHGMGLLRIQAADAEMLYARHARKRAARRDGLLRHLVYLRIPLLDPDRLLDRTVGVFGRVFSRTGFALWTLLMLVAVWKCSGRFGEMFAESSNLLSLANIPVLFVALVILKVIHEFGHAYACKRFGCEVPEMGLAMIFAMPCAYVDASASWKLESRWQRIAIGMAGMYVEAAVAAVFALIWAVTPPGLLHDVAVDVILLASVVTLLFNINPLMRFDGYYVFSDLVGMPNLWERSRQFMRRRAKRWLLGIGVGAPPEVGRRERHLYRMYGVAAFAYKVFLGFAIVAMVLMSWPLVGTLLGCAFGYVFLIRPLLQLARYLLTHPETEPVRGRARLLAYGGIVALPAALAFLPLSRSVVAPAVLESEHMTVLRAATPGFVTAIEGVEGTSVAAGAALVQLANEDLDRDLAVVVAERRAAQVRLDGAELTDPAEVPRHRARVDLLTERWQRLQRRADGLRVTTPESGTVVGRAVLTGSFVPAGAPLVEVHGGRGLLRMVLDDTEVERTGLRVGDTVELRWRICPARSVRATVRRVLPAASRSAVPDALTVLGGGPIYGALVAADGLRADRAYLHVVLVPDWVPADRTAGLTASVRVTARVETLGGWLYRHLARFYDGWRMS